MIIQDKIITNTNLTEDIINHFFSKTKLSEHTIENVNIIRITHEQYTLRLKLIPNKLSQQPKRTQTTLDININQIRNYKLNQILTPQ